mgnify:CR=1 FL=1
MLEATAVQDLLAVSSPKESLGEVVERTWGEAARGVLELRAREELKLATLASRAQSVAARMQSYAAEANEAVRSDLGRSGVSAHGYAAVVMLRQKEMKEARDLAVALSAKAERLTGIADETSKLTSMDIHAGTVVEALAERKAVVSRLEELLETLPPAQSRGMRAKLEDAKRKERQTKEDALEIARRIVVTKSALVA